MAVPTPILQCKIEKALEQLDALPFRHDPGEQKLGTIIQRILNATMAEKQKPDYSQQCNQCILFINDIGDKFHEIYNILLGRKSSLSKDAAISHTAISREIREFVCGRDIAKLIQKLNELKIRLVNYIKQLGIEDPLVNEYIGICSKGYFSGITIDYQNLLSRIQVLLLWINKLDSRALPCLFQNSSLKLKSGPRPIHINVDDIYQLITKYLDIAEAVKAGITTPGADKSRQAQRTSPRGSTSSAMGRAIGSRDTSPLSQEALRAEKAARKRAEAEASRQTAVRQRVEAERDRAEAEKLEAETQLQKTHRELFARIGRGEPQQQGSNGVSIAEVRKLQEQLAASQAMVIELKQQLAASQARLAAFKKIKQALQQQLPDATIADREKLSQKLAQVEGQLQEFKIANAQLRQHFALQSKENISLIQQLRAKTELYTGYIVKLNEQREKMRGEYAIESEELRLQLRTHELLQQRSLPYSRAPSDEGILAAMPEVPEDRLDGSSEDSFDLSESFSTSVSSRVETSAVTRDEQQCSVLGDSKRVAFLP